MRYQVRACFDTAAGELFLSPTAAEDSALLIADDCVVQLHVSSRRSDAPGASTSTVHELTVLPWDSKQMRLCVDGISYGTGPLVLRDGDRLTLQPRHPTRHGTLYTYAVTLVPVPASAVVSKEDRTSPAATCDGARAAAATAAAAAEEEEVSNRMRTIVANVEEYARWNNFYRHRFTSLVPVSHPRGCTCSAGLAHSYMCGGRAQMASAPATSSAGGGAADASLDSYSTTARTLVTLLPGLPELLEDVAAPAPSPAPPLAAPLLAMCCHCPFASPDADPARRRCATASPPPSSAAATSLNAPEATPPQRTLDAGAPSSPPAATTQSNWAAYAQARRHDWAAALKEDGATKKTDALRSRTQRCSAADGESTAHELLQRIGSLESALMGTRYE